MNSEVSVTACIEKLKASKDGDERAEQEIWNYFYSPILAYARNNLKDSPRRAEDEEDVLISVFHCILQGVRENRFTRLRNRDDLWHLLLKITERRAINQRKRQQAQKRGGGKVRGGSVFEKGHAGIEVVDASPTPESIAQLGEELRRLLNDLDRHDKSLRFVAEHKMDQYTDAEIAQKLDVTERTVQRKVNLIRSLWRNTM